MSYSCEACGRQVEGGSSCSCYMPPRILNRTACDHQWVKCSERLPKFGEPIIVTDGTYSYCAILSPELGHKDQFQFGIFCPDDDAGIYYNRVSVTHWQNLPAPPESENE